jgi:Fic family protein
MRKKNGSVWKPRYELTPSIVRALMEIEGARAVVDQLHLPPAAQAELRRRARLRSTHYSTRIEGNRLTLVETETVVEKKAATFQGRERDVREVRNYWNALLRVEQWAKEKRPLTQDLIQQLHALVEKGLRTKPSPYRDGQNSIRDVASGALVYLPPEALDVPVLMGALVAWTQNAVKQKLPPPLVAALVHYQFVTIHPYFDGNGRTARLLATFLLQRDGYGLNGYFSLEEYHARDLSGYYNALQTHPHHNYYEGRADSDITSWLEYFTNLLARVFTDAEAEARHFASNRQRQKSFAPRLSDPRSLRVIELFVAHQQITSRDVAQALGLSERMARVLLTQWVQEDWLEISEPSNRKRAYRLAVKYRQFVGNLSAM